MSRTCVIAGSDEGN